MKTGEALRVEVGVEEWLARYVAGETRVMESIRELSKEDHPVWTAVHLTPAQADMLAIEIEGRQLIYGVKRAESRAKIDGGMLFGMHLRVRDERVDRIESGHPAGVDKKGEGEG